MAFDKLRLYGRIITFFIPYGIKLLRQRITAIYHRWAYKAIPTSKNVVVVGGSWAGVELTRRLSHSLPTGYKVVLIEKNSHFHYTFNFPRFSVLQRREHTAFIPYNGIVKDAPEGIFSHITDAVESITETQVRLASGNSIDYEYLAIATGSSQPPPAGLTSTTWEDACSELRSIQGLIKGAQNIAVVGGGAVGIELVTDIKEFYPDKEVTLFHSRGQLLNSFGKRLHDHVLSVLQALKIRVLLNERVKIPGGVMGSRKVLTFSDGREEEFDLVIPCTGQRPNSSLVTSLIPESISEESNRILVKPNLQASTKGVSSTRIFALGDIAEHGGPKMARASFAQAGVVNANILSMINNREPSMVYVPNFDLEGSIKLTLGKTQWVTYSTSSDGNDLLITGDDGKVELEVKRAWKLFGADYISAEY